MSQHTKQNFKTFQQTSFSDVFSQLDTVEKIQQSVYYQTLGTKIKSNIPNNVISLQELLQDSYSVKDFLHNYIEKKYQYDPDLKIKDTLTSFVYKQFEYNMYKFIEKWGFRNLNYIIKHNKQQAENTTRQCTIK